MVKLNNKFFIVTGATDHIGNAVAEEICKANGNLILVSKNLSKLSRLKKKLVSKYKVQIKIFRCDLLNVKSIKVSINKIKKNYSYINGIVNCAYKGKTGGINFISEKDFKDASSINLIAPFLFISKLKKPFEKASKKFKQTSSIVNVASMYGIVSPEPTNYKNQKSINPIHYGATKSALIQMSKYLACNLNVKHMRVNSISPGAIPPTGKKNLSKLKKRIPLGRFGKPIEIAKPIVFLLSNDSSYINGTNLIVDGGWTSW
tara:strand:+ start:573 stop:1352 length:780 start_codon:yes stop_codon:yes gene_type:complete